MTRSSIASNVGGPYEATILPPPAYGGFIVGQHPHEHDDGGVLHHGLDKGLKRASGTTIHHDTSICMFAVKDAPKIINST